MPDDYAASTKTSGRVSVGSSATGEIETEGDRDWFKVTLKANTTYRFDLKGQDTGDGALANPYLGLHNVNGFFATGGDGGFTVQVGDCVTPGAYVTYYLAVSAAGDRTGAYELSVAEVPDDFAVGTGTTGAVAVNGSTTGEIEHGSDKDWFAVSLEAGKTYRLDLKGQPTDHGTLKDPELDGIYDADGNFVDGTGNDDGGKGLNSRELFTPTEDGTYYVEVDGRDGHTGTYKLSVTAVAADLADDTGTTGAVAVGGSTKGTIDTADDRDWFAVTLQAGKTYQVDLKGRPSGDGTLKDPYLDGIYDGDGNRVYGTWDSDGGKGRNSRETFAPDEDGTYYVAAGASGGGMGTYKLSVTEVATDLAADTGTTGAVAVGGSTTGEIEDAGDRDWFAVTLQAGKTYQVDLKGRPSGDGTLKDPYLDGIYDASGKRLRGTRDDDDGKGLNSRVTFAPDEDGTYYVAAGTWRGAGTYKLSVSEVVPDDFAADTGTTGAVAVGGSTTGEIEDRGDSDWFVVTLEAGKTYQVDLKGRPTGDGTLKNPHLDGIYDADGNSVDGTSWDYDGGKGRNSRVTFAPDEDGTYYVAAGASGDRTGTYKLSIAEVPGAESDKFTFDNHNWVSDYEPGLALPDPETSGPPSPHSAGTPEPDMSVLGPDHSDLGTILGVDDGVWM